jgi:hypothetical protein
MKKSISISVAFLIFANLIFAQTPNQELKLGEDFIIVVRLLTKKNKTDYISAQLEREDFSAKNRSDYENALKSTIEVRDKQEEYIVNAFKNNFSEDQIFFAYDYQFKGWDESKPLTLKNCNGESLNWNADFDKPFLLLASGDYTVTHLTEQSLIVLNKEFEREPKPLGMFKSVKVRGNSLFAFNSVEEQWVKSIVYLKEHLLQIFTNPSLAEELQSNLLFEVEERN